MNPKNITLHSAENINRMPADEAAVAELVEAAKEAQMADAEGELTDSIMSRLRAALAKFGSAR